MSDAMTPEERERYGRIAYESSRDNEHYRLSWDSRVFNGATRVHYSRIGTAVATAAITAERERVRAILQLMIDRAQMETKPHMVDFPAGYWEGLFDALDAITVPVDQ